MYIIIFTLHRRLIFCIYDLRQTSIYVKFKDLTTKINKHRLYGIRSDTGAEAFASKSIRIRNVWRWGSRSERKNFRVARFQAPFLFHKKANMREFTASRARGKREERIFVSFYDRKVARRTAARLGPRDPRRHRLIAAAVFFLDATKKYGGIITSFVVVPFALRES